MPSPLPTAENTEPSGGSLYVVATPIGNPEDMTLRAIRVLGAVSLIAAEDTRETGKLLAYHGISNHLISYHEFNERERSAALVEKLRAGASIALVSDAGTPMVSDPGFRLVQEAVDAGIPVVPVPGPSAAMAALSVSGLPTDAFVFVGFPSRKSGKRTRQLTALAAESRTLIFYESPKRILALMQALQDIMGDRQAMLSREMTKPYEEFIRGALSDIVSITGRRRAIKGECTLVVAGAQAAEIPSETEIRAELSDLLKKDVKPSEAARRLAAKYRMPKKPIYNEALKIREDS